MEDKESQVLNLERVQTLETWLKTTNTKLTQVNGQRKYGGPPEVWDGPVPGARCEVFISQIPRDAYEDLLIPLFSSVGPLWEFRLMMNFSGQNRGFAYAKYGTSAVAGDAIRVLHGHMLEPGSRLSVRHSTEKRHLCIGDLPATTRQEGLLQAIRLLVEGVERVALKTGPGIEGVSAIVAFTSHHSASMAKKVLAEAFKKRFALTVSIKWQSAVKPVPDEPPPPHKALKGVVGPPLKPAHHALTSAQPSALPPRLARRRPPTPPGFRRAAGRASTPPSQQQGPSGSSAALLREVCEGAGVGPPTYEMHYSHAGPDGFLYFTYQVCLPGVTLPFRGLVMILPGPSTATMLEEVRQAAAQQVLQRVSEAQLVR